MPAWRVEKSSLVSRPRIGFLILCFYDLIFIVCIYKLPTQASLLPFHWTCSIPPSDLRSLLPYAILCA